MRKTKPVAERFWAKVVLVDECWQWTGAILRNGYGYFGITAQKSVLAHRWAYQYMVTEIPKGLVIDHLCRNRACVNPEHLDVVPQKINIQRGIGVGRQRETHCPRGHELTPDNCDIRKSGKRNCRTCRRTRDRLAKQRLRALKRQTDLDSFAAT